MFSAGVVGKAEELTPAYLAKVLGKKFPPTEEQSKVISGDFGPKLVVAGAGAGKTETMASRVVWLVANGLVRPEQVLGLTFTRKAARELEQRIRRQLITLRESGIFAPGSEQACVLETIAPTVLTYDAYAGELVREYGLLIPVEPSARIITEAERYAIAHEVVVNYGAELSSHNTVADMVKKLLDLTSNMDNLLANPDSIREHEHEFRRTVDDLAKSTKSGPEYSQELLKILNAQRLRVQFLPLVEALKATQAERNVITFGEQMALAARLAETHPAVGAAQRTRFRAVMLDEYQDTSHAQRILLRSLFGGVAYEGLSVTAVGDPMQAIYGWRGATAANLEAFVEDFPQADGSPAPKDQLTTSWRNPSGVLDLANRVAGGVFGSGPRPVDELSARPSAPDGEISLGYFEKESEEIDFVADHLAGKFTQATEAGEEFSAAVLVRKNKQSPAIAKALQARGIPCEIVGSGGLLWEPEVQDLVAVATMLVRPHDSAAALRVLAGPMCGVGVADIKALSSRARNLAGSLNGEDGGIDERGPEGFRATHVDEPEEVLKFLLEKSSTPRIEQAVGLADAVADLGERDRYTPDGLERIEQLSAQLRHLRTYSLSKPLTDLFADIEAVFNVRTEVLARGSAGGATHLDKFHDMVAAFHSESLLAFLDFVALAREKEGGLEGGEVPRAKNRVLIMTVHKAKGLEFGHVCVVGADTSTYKAEAKTFVNKVEVVPGDDDYIDLDPDATKRSEFFKACKAFNKDNEARNGEENARLFYVALTRTEESLTITGAGTDNREAGRSNKKGPYAYLELLKERFPQHVVQWVTPETKSDDIADPASALFPAMEAHSDAVAGATLVAQAMQNLPQLTRGETFDVWEQDAGALIEEYRALSAPVVEVELPEELTASDIVSLSASPVEFARRQRRPIPFKPNSFAKRGTAFHAWLEERFGGAALISEDELPGIDEVPVADLDLLKKRFLDSPWAERTPEHVEAPFVISIGSATVRGRMDAVFREPDGSWLIVDWKTGRPPQGREMVSAQLQLAVYSEAWRRLHPGDMVRAAFFYVADGYLYEPGNLAAGEELARLLEDASSVGAGVSG